MRGTRGTGLLVGLTCTLLAAGAALPAASASATPASHGHLPAARTVSPRTQAGTPAWRVDQRLPLDTAIPPQEFSTGDTFLDVQAVGPDDAWAVGTSGYYLRYWGRPILRHWHDGRWLIPHVPAWMNGSVPGGWVNQLQAVGGSSPSDVWALGIYNLVTEDLVRAVHWNGQAWTKAAVPYHAAVAPLINSVLSFGTSGAWAFGCYCEASQYPYIAHFSNGRWREVTPKGLPFGGIWAASAVSASDIWAVTSETDLGSFNVVHWNGSKWATVPVPAKLQFSPGGSGLPIRSGIVATRSGGVWFAGSLAASGAPAVAHELNGHWTVTQIGAAEPLMALISDGAGGLWASSQSFGSVSGQVWHYSGGTWSQAADPAGTSGPYQVTWMARLPGSQASLAIGRDQQNELLLSYR
jgi:hypothetical protein